MIGGLGGFVLPIAFGVLNDLTGIWTSCFMLLFVIVAGALIWMHLAIQRMEREALGAALAQAARIAGNAADPRARNMSARCPVMCSRTGSRKTRRSGTRKGRAIARRNLWISIPALAACLRGLDGVVGGGRQAAGGRLQVHHRPAVLARGACRASPARRLRIFYSFMPPIFGGRLWTTLSTWSLMIPAFGIGFAVQNPDTPYIIFLVAGAAVRLRRRQLRLVDGQYQLLLPEGGEGQCAGAQCRSRQSRRQRGAVRDPAGDHRRRVRLARRRPADAGDRRDDSSGCRTPASSGCRSSPSRRSRPGSA